MQTTFTIDVLLCSKIPDSCVSKKGFSPASESYTHIGGCVIIQLCLFNFWYCCFSQTLAPSLGHVLAFSSLLVVLVLFNRCRMSLDASNALRYHLLILDRLVCPPLYFFCSYSSSFFLQYTVRARRTRPVHHRPRLRLVTHRFRCRL